MRVEDKIEKEEYEFFPEKFAPPGLCCPQQNFTMFQGKLTYPKVH